MERRVTFILFFLLSFIHVASLASIVAYDVIGPAVLVSLVAVLALCDSGHRVIFKPDFLNSYLHL